MPTTVAGTRRHTPRPEGRGGSPAPGGRSARAARAAAAAALLAFGALLSGCAHAPLPAPRLAPAAPRTVAGAPVAPAPPARPAPGYVARLDSLPPADPALLAGRRVVIDPGHGGFFKGCIGVGGLTEAEVNLGVALELRALLEARGAEVKLTRDRDRDFLTPADSSLKSDLAERVRIADAFRPDLFVSIHHNADPSGAHDVNETQTYYQLGDDGPSYDAATDVHRSLVRNLGIATQKLLPGNFAVVRGVDAPALLTESSHLTDPDVEAKLRTPEARRLEAEALLVGIARFFARRAPVVDSVWVEGRFDVGRTNPSGIDPDATRNVVHARIRGAFDRVVVRVDGIEVPATASGDRVQALLPAPLARGTHLARVSAQLGGEGASRPVQAMFEVRKLGNTRMEADLPYAELAPARTVIPVRIRTSDSDYLPWADSIAIDLHVLQPRSLQPRDTTVIARDGIAWACYRLPGRAARLPRIRLTMQNGNEEEADNEPIVFDVDSGLPLDEPGTRTGYALRMPGVVPLRDAPGTLGAQPAVRAINRVGLLSERADGAGEYHSPRIAGFRAWGPDSAWPPRYVAIAGGALFGKRVVVDPEGGGDDAAGMGPSGTRAAALNLDVARALGSMLEAAGADVLLTRDGDAAVSDVERVQRAEGFRADRYLRVGHAAAPPLAGHYFSSGAGRRWGQRLADACARLGLADSLAVGEVSRYVITQSSATALYASLARVDDPASEARLLAPGAARREAYALFVALAGEFAPEARFESDSLDVRDATGAPVPGALVTLGGALVLQAGAGGRVRFLRTEPGPLEVIAHDPRAVPGRTMLDSTRGRVPPGAR